MYFHGQKSAGMSSGQKPFKYLSTEPSKSELRRGPNLEKKTQYFRSELNYLLNFLYKCCSLWLIFLWALLRGKS
jgi:hypothetical protein